MRNECLANVRRELEEKESDLECKLKRIRAELESGGGGADVALTADALNSKKFHMNVLETRLVRQG